MSNNYQGPRGIGFNTNPNPNTSPNTYPQSTGYSNQALGYPQQPLGYGQNNTGNTVENRYSSTVNSQFGYQNAPQNSNIKFQTSNKPIAQNTYQNQSLYGYNH